MLRECLGAYPGFLCAVDSVERVDKQRGAGARQDAVSEKQRHRQLPVSARLQADGSLAVRHGRIRIFGVHSENWSISKAASHI